MPKAPVSTPAIDLFLAQICTEVEEEGRSPRAPSESKRHAFDSFLLSMLQQAEQESGKVMDCCSKYCARARSLSLSLAVRAAPFQSPNFSSNLSLSLSNTHTLSLPAHRHRLALLEIMSLMYPFHPAASSSPL